MTAITRYSGANWNKLLPLMPKTALDLGFTVSHEYDASALEALPGTAVTSWSDRLSGPPLTNAVGGVLRSEGRSKYIEFSGVSGSLSATSLFTSGSLRTILVVARVNTNDTLSGVGPVFSWNNDAVVQNDVDRAGIREATTATVPAARDRWHIYAVTFPAQGNGLFAVDDNAVEFAPLARGLTTLALAIGLSDRRQLRVAHIVTSPEALTAAELVSASKTMRDHYGDLKFV